MSRRDCVVAPWSHRGPRGTKSRRVRLYVRAFAFSAFSLLLWLPVKGSATQIADCVIPEQRHSVVESHVDDARGAVASLSHVRTFDADWYRVTSAGYVGDNAMAIVNAGSNEILFYNSAGALARRVGGTGDGPAEFAQVFRAHVTDSRLVGALDAGRRRVVLFDSDGALEGSVRLPFVALHNYTDVYPLPDGTWIAHMARRSPSREMGLRRGRAVFVRISSSGDTIASIAEVEGNQTFIWWEDTGGGIDMTPPFALHTVSTVSREGCLFVGTADSFEIDVYDVWTGLRRSVRLLGVDQSLESAEWDSRIAAIRERNREHHGEFSALSHIPRPSKTPAYTNIVAGEDGSIWVRPYRGDGNGRGGWWVFRATGRLVMWVSQPDERPTGLLAVGKEGRIVVRQVNDLGVETIAEYRVVGSSQH